MPASRKFIYILFALFFCAHAGFSFYARDIKAAWANVPPAPSQNGMSSAMLGDKQFSYRMICLMLQNLGNSGGRLIKFEEYNYDDLEDWLFLAQKMDARSNYVPMLAAYYFSHSSEPEDLDHIITFLAEVGANKEGEKWRWLAQAVYLARYKKEDYDLAFTLATQLADLWEEGRPAWMKQMPALIMTAKGDQEAAYDIIVKVIQEEGDKMHPAEVNNMLHYLCGRILTKENAGRTELCQGFYQESDAR